MAFNNYSDLQTQIGNWLARSDLTTNLPDFITLFEAQAARKMRVRPMETTATLTPASGSAALPSDYLGYRRATVIASPRVQMDYVTPSHLQGLYPDGISGTPSYFTIEGSAIKTRSSDTTSIEFLYFAKNTAVSIALNWLYTNHPDAYLFGSLAEAYAFIQDFEKMQLWGGRRDKVFDDIRLVNFREGSDLAVRTVGAHP